MRFAGRVAVVTGAAGGLGSAYATALAREGAIVALVDRQEDPLLSLQALIEAEGGKAITAPVDLTSPGAVEKAVDEIVKKAERIDILINNAGGGSSSPGNASSVRDIEPAAWTSLLDVNLNTAFLCTKYVSPVMRRNRYGRVVNVSSRSARVADPGFEQSPAYACAKAAVLALTRFSARELGPHGITVNCLVPSMVISGPVLAEYWDRLQASAKEEYLKQVALKRLPEIREMVGPVLFLASDDSAYMTGVSLDVNGGSFMPA